MQVKKVYDDSEVLIAIELNASPGLSFKDDIKQWCVKNPEITWGHFFDALEEYRGSYCRLDMTKLTKEN